MPKIIAQQCAELQVLSILSGICYNEKRLTFRFTFRERRRSMTLPLPPILLTDVKYRASLAAVQALGKAGYPVYIAQTEAELQGTPPFFPLSMPKAFFLFPALVTMWNIPPGLRKYAILSGLRKSRSPYSFQLEQQRFPRLQDIPRNWHPPQGFSSPARSVGPRQ